LLNKYLCESLVVTVHRFSAINAIQYIILKSTLTIQ